MNQDGRSVAKEILFEDFKYLCDSFWKNEEGGEKRVQFFITLVTAVLAATATMIAKSFDPKSYDSIYGISLFSLLGLFIFGMITLLRILKRNAVADGYKHDMDEIRKRFKDHFDPCGVLSGYEPFGGASKQKFPLRKIGGLSHMVAALNSIILAALAIVICLIEKRADSSALTVPSALKIIKIVLLIFGIFGVSYLAQYFFINKTERQSKENLKSLPLTHAGGIVWKKINEESHFLIITAKNEPTKWVFPKGHINENEDPAETAVREVREEAGIKAHICGTVGYSNYDVDLKVIRVKFYLMEYGGDEKEIKPEGREKRWCTFNEAAALLTHEDSRRLLRFTKCILS